MLKLLLIPLVLGQTGTLKSTIEARYDKAAAVGFTGSVLVVKSGAVILSKSYGLADKSKSIPIRANTIFPIGSVTKWFTAMVALRLEQDMKLKISDPISNYISNVPADKKSITIQHLITHSAGLPEYVDREGEGGDFAPFTKPFALKRILGEKLLFKPGSKSEYSNAGYTLLAAVIEKASGMPFQKCVRKFVFEPAGMQRSGFFGETKWPASEFAIGYNAKQHGKQNAPCYWGPTTWSIMGAGGIVSTPGDLGRAILALTQGKILNAATEPRMFQPLFGNEGFGWMAVRNGTGNPFCNVGGGTDYGFHCTILYLPNEGNLVVSCSSSDTPMKIGDANGDVLKFLQAKSP